MEGQVLQMANPNKALWEKGDFTRIAETMRESGEDLVDTLDIRVGMKVLDLGSGDGTTALPAAELGATVLGVDIAENLVAAGNTRAQAAGLDNLRFQQGDASDLAGIEDDSFDLVVSVFGAMFAPKPLDVAREMVRVTRPGGRIVMGNWIPGDPTLVAQILKISAAYTPAPPAGFISPMTWGDPEVVRDRFQAAGIPASNVQFQRATWFFRYPGEPAELLYIFRRFYGPTMKRSKPPPTMAGRRSLDASCAPCSPTRTAPPAARKSRRPSSRSSRPRAETQPPWAKRRPRRHCASGAFFMPPC